MRAATLGHRAGILAGLLLASTGAQAAADIRGTVTLPGGDIVPPGSVATVVLTATNAGPDQAENVGMAAAFTPNVGSRNFEIVAVAETAPCTIRFTDFVAPPGQLSTVAVSISTGQALAAGASATCVVGLRTFPESASPQTVNFGFSPRDQDPDTSNNTIGVQILTAALPAAVEPRMIPTARLHGLLMLVLGIVVVGTHVLRRSTP